MAPRLGVPLNNIRGPYGKFVGLLDKSFAIGATAAYSLRLLRAKHSGGLIRGRASNSGINKGEADVLPDSDKVVSLNSKIENLNPTAQNRLGTNAGGGDKVFADLVNANGGTPYDGLVPNWYEQTSNQNDATNSTAAEQPKIYDSSSGLVKENGKPAIEFDGSDDYLITNSKIGISDNPDLSSFSVLRVTSNTNFGDYPAYFSMEELEENKGYAIVFRDRKLSSDYWNIRRTGSTNIDTSNIQLYSQFHFSGTKVTKDNLFINGVEDTGIAKIEKSGFPNIKNHELRIGTLQVGNPARHIDCFSQELIIYKDDKSNNRKEIENNIINHYGI